MQITFVSMASMATVTDEFSSNAAKTRGAGEFVATRLPLASDTGAVTVIVPTAAAAPAVPRMMLTI